jgi:hypothetical protein
MKLYFAGCETDFHRITVAKCGGTRILATYYAMEKKNKESMQKFFDTAKGMDIFLDCGAFSAFTKNLVINIKRYMQFITDYKFTTYAGLDVIGDAVKTIENNEIMRKEGFKPIVTFHRGSDFKYLRLILNAGYEYMALGGLAGLDVGASQRVMFLDNAFKEILKYNPKIKVHGFGMTGEDIMRDYPWHSVDSTAWLSPVKFGRMNVNGEEMHVNEFVKRKYDETKDHELFCDKGGYEAVCIEMIKQTLEMEKKINEYNKNRDWSKVPVQESLFEL